MGLKALLGPEIKDDADAAVDFVPEESDEEEDEIDDEDNDIDVDKGKINPLS